MAATALWPISSTMIIAVSWSSDWLMVDHLAELHQLLDDFRRLHRHLVRELGDRNGFRHMHFEHAGLDWRRRRAFLLPVAVVAATAARAATPIAATDAAAGIAAGLDFLLLGRVAGPARRELGRFDFLASTGTSCSRGGAGRGRRTGTGCRCCGLVQRALHAQPSPLGGGLLRRLVRHQHAGRRIHHGADGLSFGQGLATAFVQVSGAYGFLICTCLGLGGGLGLGVILGLRCGGLCGGLAIRRGRSFFRGFRSALRYRGRCGRFGSLLLGGCLCFLFALVRLARP